MSGVDFRIKQAVAAGMAPVIPARQPAILFGSLYHKTASDIAPLISPVALFKEATP